MAVDSYIYIIGGTETKHDIPALTECARFDTEKSVWQKIAPLNEARKYAFGVGKNEKIFIAGGWDEWQMNFKMLNTFEVYNILKDEWQCIASLTLCRFCTSIVLVDETLYSRLPITRTLANSNLALTRTKIDFPWISFIHLL